MTRQRARGEQDMRPRMGDSRTQATCSGICPCDGTRGGRQRRALRRARAVEHAQTFPPVRRVARSAPWGPGESQKSEEISYILAKPGTNGAATAPIPITILFTIVLAEWGVAKGS